MRILLVLCLSILSSLSAEAARTSFDADWKFQLGDQTGAEKASFNDASWRMLDVPHDWSIEGEYKRNNPMGGTAGYLPAGIGWYRKNFPVTPEMKGKHVEVAFDGVFMNSTVWANGKKLGTRPYGWSSFSYDISDLVRSSDAITIAVRVDNEKQPAARWYTGSGIYAHTWLDVKDPIHVPNSGVFIQTRGTELRLETEIANTTSRNSKVDVETFILDRSGKVVGNAKTLVLVKGSKTETAQQQLSVATAQPWSPETPTLYTAVTQVSSEGRLLDRVETRFGFRDIKWKVETGMWLNGKNVKLRGVCNHQDAGALGASVPDKVLRFRIEQLKAMGCNAIRTAHNPQTPIFYEICDEVGMMVMDEIFDGWKKKAAHDYGRYFFNEWWKQELTDWIRRDRNHPSVVIYSVGNETGGKVGKDIVALCHKLDPTRPVTSGHSGTEYMDVEGVNGRSENKGYFDSHVPDKVFIGTENTHTWQVRGYYRTKTWYRDGPPTAKRPRFVTPDLTDQEIFTHDWIEANKRGNRKQVFNSSYDNATVRVNSRRNIQQLRDVPYYAGSFRWTGHDYLGEASYVHGGWPFKAFMGGAIDLANFEKDLYYLYQSQWTDKPMVHILPHWTHPMIKEGTEIPVWVYTNGDSAELFCNGESLGVKTPGTGPDTMQCQWLVPWMPGELKAVAMANGKAVAQASVRTAGPPARIALSVDGESLAETGKDIVQVRVTTQDQKGELYPYGENRTFFHVIGPGGIRALDNGSPIDVEKHFGVSDRIAFYGLTRAYVESTGEIGDIALLASCILGEKKQITSNQVSIDSQVLALRGVKLELNIETFYTIDGSKPDRNSTRYAGSFSVPLGTTVKAIVFADGKPVQTLEERFAADVGFVWNQDTGGSEGGGSLADAGGEQAEAAKFKGAIVNKNGKGFNGAGYLNFRSNKGAFVEWYQENDGDEGEVELVIRYSGKTKGREGRTIQVSVNGKITHEQLMLPNTNSWGSDWKTVTVDIPIGRGANTIRLTTVERGGMYIDEIDVR